MQGEFSISPGTLFLRNNPNHWTILYTELYVATHYGYGIEKEDFLRIHVRIDGTIVVHSKSSIDVKTLYYSAHESEVLLPK